jgi:hypothetical protein
MTTMTPITPTTRTTQGGFRERITMDKKSWDFKKLKRLYRFQISWVKEMLLVLFSQASHFA